MLPEPNTLSCPETRQRQRYLDLMVNQDSMQAFVKRTQILQELRQFLGSSGFTEVETPILDRAAGGANARPF